MAQTLTDLLASHPFPDDLPLVTNLLDKEVMTMDTKEDKKCIRMTLSGAQRMKQKKIR